MVFNEELGGPELVGVHGAQQHLLQGLHGQILSKIYTEGFQSEPELEGGGGGGSTV